MPKIGDKVSMLANVRETLSKRYQLAKTARVEAQRRLVLIDRINDLRGFIKAEVDFRPLIGHQDQQRMLYSKVAYTEVELVNGELW